MDRQLADTIVRFLPGGIWRRGKWHRGPNFEAGRRRRQDAGFQLLAVEREHGFTAVAFQADSSRRVHEPPNVGLHGLDLILHDYITAIDQRHAALGPLRPLAVSAR